MLRLLLVFLSSILVFTACKSDEPQPLSTEDLVKERPGMIKILFQNDFVLVLKMTIKPGEALPVHREKNRIMLAEADCELEIVEGGKKPVRKQFIKNEFAWYDAMVHSIRNPGSADVKMYIISRKQIPLPAKEQIDESLGKAQNAHIRLENKQVIINEMFLGAGRKLASPAGYYRLVYAMNEFQMRQMDDEGNAETILYNPGQFRWYDSRQYQIENVGDTDARYLVLEFLK